MSVAEALVMIGVGLVQFSACFAYLYVNVNRTSPVGVLRRLRESPTGYVVRLRGTNRGWNPDSNTYGDGIVGPGVATYALETSPEGIVSVRLDWQPIGARPRQMMGVVNQRLSGFADYKCIGKVRVTPPLVFITQVALSLTGVLVALGFTNGHVQHERVTAVFVGSVSGFVVPLLIFPLALRLASWRSGPSPSLVQPQHPPVRLVLAMPVLSGSGGAVLGWLLAGGKPGNDRGLAIAGGLIAGLFLSWLLLLAGLVVDAVRKTIRPVGKPETTEIP